MVICFAGLDDPKYEAWDGPESQMGKGYTGEIPEQEVSQRPKSPNDGTETPPTLSHSDSVDTETGMFEKLRDTFLSRSKNSMQRLFNAII